MSRAAGTQRLQDSQLPGGAGNEKGEEGRAGPQQNGAHCPQATAPLLPARRHVGPGPTKHRRLDSAHQLPLRNSGLQRDGERPSDFQKQVI